MKSCALGTHCCVYLSIGLSSLSRQSFWSYASLIHCWLATFTISSEQRAGGRPRGLRAPLGPHSYIGVVHLPSFLLAKSSSSPHLLRLVILTYVDDLRAMLNIHVRMLLLSKNSYFNWNHCKLIASDGESCLQVELPLTLSKLHHTCR